MKLLLYSLFKGRKIMEVKIDSVASSQLYSFSSQEVFLATQLIELEKYNCYVSLEKIGDVGVEGEINSITELKNAQSKQHNPLANKSIDLWKTLYNWTKFFYDNHIDLINYDCILYVNSSNNCAKDIARDLELCKEPSKFQKLLKRIKKEVIGNENYRSKKQFNIKQKGKHKDSVFYAENLLSVELKNTFKQVVCHFRIEHSNISYLDTLKSRLEYKYGFSDSILEEVMIMLLGRVKKRVLEALHLQRPVMISTDEIKEFNEEVLKRYFTRGKFQLHENTLPSDDEIKASIHEKPLYIRQLEIIGIFDFYNAVSSCIRFNKERRSWIQDGYLDSIDDPKFLEFLKKQKVSWNINKEEVLIEDDDKEPTQQGKLILYKCMKGNQETLENEVLDPELQRGIFYEMSNSDFDDTFSIGWHPNYKELLDGDENDEE